MNSQHALSKCAGLLAGAALSFILAGPASAQTPPQASAPEPGHFKVKYYGRFSELPVGAVQPRGWLRHWLENQANGLTGHPENLSYPYDTCMYAGIIPPPPYTNKWWSPWWPYEQSGYYVDGLTRLSWLIQDPAINRRRDANLGYILDHSNGGSLGASHWCWPNAVVGRALLAQFSATGNPRVAEVLDNALLKNADEITRLRGANETFYVYRNGANAEEAFYLYGLTGDRRLLELGRKVYDNYLEDTNSFCSLEKIENSAPFREHGVTAAETLKCLPLMYLYTGDAEALRLARRAYEKVVDNSLMPDGGIVSSENLGPSRFDSLHESCDITDWSWSLGYLFMATGDARWADLIERATFNALPGAVTKDFRQLQYFSAVNQVVIAATNSRVPYCPTRMTYRAAHDTECCAGNINRAMPDYVIRMWMRSAEGGLAAVFYGPSEVTTTVRGQKVIITEETEYPFRDSISFRVNTAKPVIFDLQCRIPQWCGHAAIQVNGEAQRMESAPGTFAVIRREFKDGDVVSLKLPMAVKVEDWFQNRSVCLTRGPLVYSLRITEKRVEHFSDPPDILPLLRGHNIQGFPEVEFYPESDWRCGFDAALTNQLSKIRVVESRMTENPFIENQTPIRLEVPLSHLPEWFPGWKPETPDAPGAAARVPAEPSALPTTQQSRVEGRPATMVLVPYGATHLRLTTLPLVFTPQPQEHARNIGQPASSTDWRTQSIYQIVTDRFYNGDPSNDNTDGNFNPAGSRSVHGGDFKGIEEKLDYIQALGATAIWISPIVLNANGAFHGYAGRDFYRVDPHWGGLADLRRLVQAAHARGLRVIDDVVVNHGGDLIYSRDPGYPNFKYPPAGYNLSYRSPSRQFAAPFNTNAANPNLTNLFHNDGAIQNFNDPTQAELGELGGLDDFRTESPYIRSNMVAVYEYWIQRAGFDGFRVDTVKHVEMGFWRNWCPLVRQFAAANGKPDFFMFGEVLDASNAKCGSYTGAQGGGAFKLDSVLDYPLYFLIHKVFATASGNTAEIEGHYAALPGNYDPSAQDRLVTFLDNHDQARFLSPGSANDNIARLKVALVFLYTARGIPCLYYGTEQGFDGTTDPNDREDMFAGRFEQGPSLGDNFNMTHPLFQWIARLNNLRRLYPALLTGSHSNEVSDPTGPGPLAYSRQLGGTQEVFIALNTANSARVLPGRTTIYPPGTTLVNLLDTNEAVTVAAGSQTPPITVPGASAKIFIAQSQLLPLDPVVTSVSPAHDAAGVPDSTPLVLHFSKPMNTNSVMTAFSTIPAVGGTCAWSPAGDCLTFTPRSRWPALSFVTVRVAAAARDAVSGNTFHAGFESRFSTARDGTPSLTGRSGGSVPSDGR